MKFRPAKGAANKGPASNLVYRCCRVHCPRLAMTNAS